MRRHTRPSEEVGVPVPDYEPAVRDKDERVPTKVTVGDDGVYTIEFLDGGELPGQFSMSVRLITDDFSDEVQYLLVNLDGGRRRWVPPDSELANWLSIAILTFVGEPITLPLGEAGDLES
jgi:hypothetical protein